MIFGSNYAFKVLSDHLFETQIDYKFIVLKNYKNTKTRYYFILKLFCQIL